jgi:hypothetical protein
MRTLYIVRRLNRAERKYVPQSYSGRVLVFRGKGLYEEDPAMGWSGLAREIQSCEIGDGGLRTRRDIMNEPLVSQVARELTQFIAQVCSARPDPPSAVPFVLSPKQVESDPQAVRTMPATESVS